MDDLFQKGKEIENNLKKSLYYEKKQLPQKIFKAILFPLILSIIFLLLYIFLIILDKEKTMTIPWTVIWAICVIPCIVKMKNKAGDTKNEYLIDIERLTKSYQNTFDAFVFYECIERILLNHGFAYGDLDVADDSDNPYNTDDTKHFYKYTDYLDTLVAMNERTNLIFGYTHVRFNWSLLNDRSFWYSHDTFSGRIGLKLTKHITGEVVIVRNDVVDFNLNESFEFKKIVNLDNSQFNNMFATYATDSIDVFKILTPAYMEKLFKFSEHRPIKDIRVSGEEIYIDVDSNFPALDNPEKGFDVRRAITNAQQAAQTFIMFMNDVLSIWP